MYEFVLHRFPSSHLTPNTSRFRPLPVRWFQWEIAIQSISQVRIWRPSLTPPSSHPLSNSVTISSQHYLLNISLNFLLLSLLPLPLYYNGLLSALAGFILATSSLFSMLHPEHLGLFCLFLFYFYAHIWFSHLLGIFDCSYYKKKTL